MASETATAKAHITKRRIEVPETSDNVVIEQRVGRMCETATGRKASAPQDVLRHAQGGVLHSHHVGMVGRNTRLPPTTGLCIPDGNKTQILSAGVPESRVVLLCLVSTLVLPCSVRRYKTQIQQPKPPSRLRPSLPRRSGSPGKPTPGAVWGGRWTTVGSNLKTSTQLPPLAGPAPRGSTRQR